MEEEYKDYTIKIQPDEDAESPRQWDNLGTMVCWHRDYILGDEKSNGYDDSPSEFAEWADGNADIALIMPLYLYDHSGLRIKVGSFAGLLPQGHAEWDSGQVGWIYVTKEALRKEYSVKRITAKILAQARHVLMCEVGAYDQFLSGDVWGYDIEGIADGSCWGFYGYDECLSEAKAVIDAHIEEYGPRFKFGEVTMKADDIIALLKEANEQDLTLFELCDNFASKFAQADGNFDNTEFLVACGAVDEVELSE